MPQGVTINFVALCVLISQLSLCQYLKVVLKSDGNILKNACNYGSMRIIT